MKSSLRVLLHEIIDYAGLFPPARLEMQPALANYLRYHSGPHAWMLGRFVCPCTRLEELAGHYTEATTSRTGLNQPRRQHSDELPADPSGLRLTVLGRGGDTAGTFLDGLRADLNDIRALLERCAGRAHVECYEARFPPEVLANHHTSTITRFIRSAGQSFVEAGVETMPAFFELPLSPHVEQRLDALIHQLPEAGPTGRPPIRQQRDVVSRPEEDTRRQPAPLGISPAGLKLRTGGTDAAAIPGARQVARVIVHCVKQGVPLKFTAGLHHPFRHFDADLRAMTHGFLNVFVAAVLAQATALELDDVQAVLEEQDGREFRFDDQYLSWNEALASLDEIEGVRRRVAISFGSCSFDEPREGLAALGLL